MGRSPATNSSRMNEWGCALALDLASAEFVDVCEVMNMETLTLTVSEALWAEVVPYQGNLGELLRLGLRQVKMEQALALFKQGGISLWRAARLAGVSLREMAQYAAAQGLRAPVDEALIQEELA
jgi:hypothetical protein